MISKLPEKSFRRPFQPEDVEFKVQATVKNGESALCVAYVDARLVQERLNKLLYGQWSNEFREVYEANSIKAVECTIKIPVYDETTKDILIYSHADVGSFDNVNEKSHGLKAVYSDSFKRAAVHFGIAQSLYTLPQMYLDAADLYKNKNGEIKGLAKAGTKKLMDKYETWLETNGIDEFGEPM